MITVLDIKSYSEVKKEIKAKQYTYKLSANRKSCRSSSDGVNTVALTTFLLFGARVALVVFKLSTDCDTLKLVPGLRLGLGWCDRSALFPFAGVSTASIGLYK